MARVAEMNAVRAVLGRPGLRLLLAAGLISLTGDWVMRIGLTYYIYALTGSTLASASMLLASFVPQIALSSLAGSSPHLPLSSGAGHDAQIVAATAPVGMIFVPSIGGISHAPDADLVAGADALTATAAVL